LCFLNISFLLKKTSNPQRKEYFQDRRKKIYKIKLAQLDKTKKKEFFTNVKIMPKYTEAMWERFPLSKKGCLVN
jgi:hypothetical protein